LIAAAAGIEYRTLIGEILEGGLKRLREKRREAKAAEGKSLFPLAPTANGGATSAGNSNGSNANGNGNGSGNTTGAAGDGKSADKPPAVAAAPGPVIIPPTE
jgi:hypothetical protein